MEQLIGCDAHKKFSVFVAVNEISRRFQTWLFTGGEDRQLYEPVSYGPPPLGQVNLTVSTYCSA